MTHEHNAPEAGCTPEEQAAWHAGLAAGREIERNNAAEHEIPGDPCDHEFIPTRGPVVAGICHKCGELASARAPLPPKRRPYNASGSLSEYGVFPECDAQPAISGYSCTVPDDCETLHWRGQILSMNELASVAQPAVGEEIMINVEDADVYTLPLQSSGMAMPRFVVHVPAQPSASAEPVAWAAVHFGGRRDGKIYTTCDTREQIEAYIQGVHQSSDSLTLRARPLAFADAPVAAQPAAATTAPSDENGGHRLMEPDHETALALADAPRSLRNYVAALRSAIAAQETYPQMMPAELSQFLSDVMTAAGLVSHGKQCKALGERLGDACMRLRLHCQELFAAPVAPAANAQCAQDGVRMTDIKLPPLPEARIVSYQTDSTMRRMELRTYSDRDMQAYAREAVRLNMPEGWRLVPVEPTQEMWEASGKAVTQLTGISIHHDIVSRVVFNAMLNAAPAQPAARQEQAEEVCRLREGE